MISTMNGESGSLPPLIGLAMPQSFADRAIRALDSTLKALRVTIEVAARVKSQ
jgi:hypothetical protein